MSRRSSPPTQVYVPPPQLPEAPAALEALRGAPGPSPWYLSRPGTEIDVAGDLLHWQSAGDRHPHAGKMLLRSSAGEVLAVCDFYCYVKPLPNSRFLVWYQEEVGVAPVVLRHTRFRLMDAAQLTPISDVSTACANLGGQSRFYAETGEIESIAFSTALDDGAHLVSLPSVFRELGELLFLAYSTGAGRRGNARDSPDLRLWILDTLQGRIEIVPQDWFNEGAFDVGYQWVTRVARLSTGGAIVGEGFRLGVFKLDDTNRNVAQWLAEDKFYHP